MTKITLDEFASNSNLSSARVIQALSKLGVAATSLGMMLDDQLQVSILARVDSDDILRRLVLTAFETARSKGVADWRAMTTPVLKNRLLQTTGGSFDEADWGAKSMPQLVLSMPDLLSLETATRPPIARLKVSEIDVSEAAVKTLKSRARVRQDLWNAVMDYSSGNAWTWSGGRAVPATDKSGEREFPTISKETLQNWREAFAGEQEITDESNRHQKRRWQESSAGTSDLPSSLRGAWNEYVKAKVVGILTGWFVANGEEPPADLLVSAPDARRGSASNDPRSDLRTLIGACVDAMSDTELRSLAIPAEVVLRALAKHPGLLG